MVNHREVHDVGSVPESVLSDKQTIKVHLKDGSLLLFYEWEFFDKKEIIQGIGEYFSANREKVTLPVRANSSENKQLSKVLYVGGNKYVVPYELCVLVETNEYKGFNVISPLLMSYSTLCSAFTFYCLTDPKACFGSCPTIYLYDDENKEIVAEGFSSSITKSMEATDVDFICDISLKDSVDQIKLELQNEAFETHYVRYADLLVVKKASSTHVVYGKDGFYEVDHIKVPKSVEGIVADNLPLFQYADHQEYLALADTCDLNTKESIVFVFDEFEGANSGIVLTQRQSFMTTFLFYQSMAHMGTKAGELLARYERSSPLVRKAFKSMDEVLGGVDIEVEVNNKWKKVGTIKEQGPIVCDTHIVPVNYKNKISKVRLTMTKGLWRIDRVNVCNVVKKSKSEVIQASSLINYNQEDCSILQELNDKEKMIVNLPGTSHTLIYKLPEYDNYAVFVETRGYYTEWMRKEWLKEESEEMIDLILYNPKKWIRLMTPQYKHMELEMETLFWMSKYAYAKRED